MEDKEKVGSPSSSFTNDLFGAKESPASNGIFSSIFPSPSTNDDLWAQKARGYNEDDLAELTAYLVKDVAKHAENNDKGGASSLVMVLGRNNNSELVRSSLRQSAGGQVWNKVTTGDVSKNGEGSSCSTSNKERSSIFQEKAEPCPLSSSIYYGGQEDMYMKSSNSQTLGSYPDFKKDGKEDDQNGNNSHGACRGNWWQGSLYY